jgi:Ribosomal silencing factor during starvation
LRSPGTFCGSSPHVIGALVSELAAIRKISSVVAPTTPPFTSEKMTARALAIGSKCQSCRYGVLQSFAAVAGVSIGAPTAPRSSIRRVNQRPFASTSKRLEHPTSLVDFKVLEDEPPREFLKAPKRNQPEPEEMVPWYLQEEAPKRAPSHPLGDRQRIPDLPDNPPPILKDLLHHISVDIGLDDLALLDLRNLDPPPALGSNLLMIIGTARSIKHLNVSGDRLCRWLRSEHKLRPYADGLLGRNELKLKLRRKARRAKLLSSVGSSMGEGPDDGISTGWVCVNIGEIESGNEAAEEQQEEGFVGFGRSSGGVKIVVQMLTEEKRIELDLESLWGGLSELQGNAEAGESRSYEDGRAPESVRQVPDILHSPTADSGLMARSTPMRSRRRVHQHRNYHTTRKGRDVEKAEENVEYEGLDPSSLEPRLSFEEIKSQPGPSDVRPEMQESPGPGPRADYTEASAQAVLQSLLMYLGDRSRTIAVSQLGDGHQDRDSTEWLKKFYNLIEGLPSHSREDRFLDLYCLGVRFMHPGYPRHILLTHFQEMRVKGNDISETAFFNVICALLAPIPDDRPHGDTGELLPQRVPMDNVEDAIGIVEDMGLRGRASRMERIFLMLHEAIASQLFIDPQSQPDSESQSQRESESRIQPEGDSTQMVDSTQNISAVHKAHDRVHDVMDVLGVEWSTDESYMTILQLHADTDHWDAFWRVWGQISICFRPRSSELYSFMFHNVARSGHQKRCIDTLDTYLPMMECEDPPVKLEGEVARSVMDCLKVVDPDIEQKRYSGSNGVGKWVRLWNQALEGLGEARPQTVPQSNLGEQHDERWREQEDERQREVEDERWREG